MKKIILFILLLSGISFAQYEWANGFTAGDSGRFENTTVSWTLVRCTYGLSTAHVEGAKSGAFVGTGVAMSVFNARQVFISTQYDNSILKVSGWFRFKAAGASEISALRAYIREEDGFSVVAMAEQTSPVAGTWYGQLSDTGSVGDLSANSLRIYVEASGLNTNDTLFVDDLRVLVSCDTLFVANAGTDRATGGSATPVKTIDEVDKRGYYNGGTFAFKAGDVWHERLDIAGNTTLILYGGTDLTVIDTVDFNDLTCTVDYCLYRGIGVVLNDDNVTINYTTCALDTPQYVYPTDTDTDIPVTPTLLFTQVASADSYYVKVSKNADLTSALYDTAIADTSLAVSLDYITQYYWLIGAKIPTDTTWNDTISFTTADLDTPTYVYPLDAATGIEASPTLKWFTITYADSYRVQLSALSDLSVNLYDTTIADTELAVSLDYITQYYWLLNSKNDLDTTFADTVSFTTKKLATPTNRVPIANATYIDSATTFSWATNAEADSYFVQIGDSALASVLLDTAVVANSLLYTLVNDSSYWWSVAAKNSLDTSAWADTTKFTTGVYAESVSGQYKRSKMYTRGKSAGY